MKLGRPKKKRNRVGRPSKPKRSVGRPRKPFIQGMVWCMEENEQLEQMRKEEDDFMKSGLSEKQEQPEQLRRYWQNRKNKQ